MEKGEIEAMRACSIAPCRWQSLIGCRRRRSRRCSITDPTSVRFGNLPHAVDMAAGDDRLLLESAFAPLALGRPS